MKNTVAIITLSIVAGAAQATPQQFETEPAEPTATTTQRKPETTRQARKFTPIKSIKPIQPTNQKSK